MAAFALNLLIFLPLLAAVVIALLPAGRSRAAHHVALAVGLLTGVLAVLLWLVTGAAAGLTAETMLDWIRLLDTEGGGLIIRYHLGLDAISAPLLALTGVLVPLSVACSLTAVRDRQKEYYAWLMVLAAAMYGVFAARDVLLFYVFFEFTLVPLYFLIGIWGGPQRRFAAMKFFIFTFVGSVFTFAGLIYVAVRVSQINGTGVVDFDFRAIFDTLGAVGSLTATEQVWLFLALFAGFAVKVPLFPLHTWLPLAHTEAPTAGSVLLAGVLLKLGTYGFLRLALPILPEGTLYWAEFMAGLAVAGIIYGALCSWVQRDVKKLVAYSSVSHLGFCMLGMFSLLPMGLSGSVLYMVNHGISTGALFLVVGMVYERYHTRDMAALGGLAWQMPVMAFFLVIFTLSSVGLPGTNGFVSEFTTLFAAFNSPILGPVYGILGATGILLGAVYMLYMVGRILFGPVQEPSHTPDLSAGLTRDLNPREIAILTPLAVLVFVLGMAPWLITDTLDPTLNREVLARFDHAATSPSAIAGTVPPRPELASAPLFVEVATPDWQEH